ncbi:MAG: TIGR02996 domain-containing protein [Planctomycetia bacterium]|nr:TIGR02996 domain-containing protein [Planctomycetia bacterium]
MHDEDGFLSAIRLTPADDIARLVFADWLDEQDDPTCKAKADFIRRELRMDGEDPNQLQQLASFLDRDWLAIVSHPKLEACRSVDEVECPKQWARLTPTENPRLRFCGSCQKPVRYCDSLAVARDHARLGNCIAVSLALVREVDDLSSPVGEPQIGDVHFVSEVIQRHRLLPRSRPPVQPPPPDEPTEDLPPPPREPRRQKTRCRNRNIERENWEEME